MVQQTGCFSGNTKILTDRGYIRLDELPSVFTVINHTGKHQARVIIHQNNAEILYRMGDGFSTASQPFKIGNRWVPASDVLHEIIFMNPRTVYDVEVASKNPDDHHYLLDNGLTAHTK
jgi:hypothetical protein